MGSWEQKKLGQMPCGMLCAFTRQWKKEGNSALLRARDWYRDCHVVVVDHDGDYVICAVVIMGRITYDGQLTSLVAPRMDDRSKRHRIRLHKDMPINLWDPSD